MPPRPTPNFYALLKVERTATPEQIERAFDAARHTALSDGAGPDLVELIEQAYLTLIDPALRRAHDASLDGAEASRADGAAAQPSASLARAAIEAHGKRQRDVSTSGEYPCILVAPAPALLAGEAASVEAVLESSHPFYAPESSAPFSGREMLTCQDAARRHAGVSAPPPAAAERPATSKPPPKTIPRSTPPRGTAVPSGVPQRAGDAREASAAGAFTGAQLRRVREARGLSLQALSEQTKVSLAHLENIEAERFAQLPPPVYLRGFLMLIARALKLDPLRVTKDFLDQMSADRPG